VKAELFGDLDVAYPLPATGDDAGSVDPVCGGVTAAGELVDLALLFSVFGLASAE